MLKKRLHEKSSHHFLGVTKCPRSDVYFLFSVRAKGLQNKISLHDMEEASEESDQEVSSDSIEVNLDLNTLKGYFSI